ncbi:mechanosensitive ion channel family protein [Planctomycetota bacterium]|nr:mechanosensitive ion channel family protein [Planctomycetota bacterium]
MRRFLTALLLTLFSCCLFAQDALPPLPEAPYVQEDIEVLEQHLADRTAKIDIAKDALKAAQEAEKEEGIPPEILAARKTATTQAQAVVTELELRITEIKDGLKDKATFPTRAEAEAKRIHDEKLARITEIHAALTPRPSTAGEVVEGSAAKQLRLAIDSYLHIRQLVEASEGNDGKSHPLYEELTGLEKISFRLRLAEENLHLAIRQYDTLRSDVFGAFMQYELLAIEAAGLHLEIKDGKEDAITIVKLWRDRHTASGSSTSEEEFLSRMNIRDFSGALNTIQQAIDVREDLRDQLLTSYDHLKDIESRAQKTAAPAEEGEPEATGEKEEYIILSEQIDDLKKELRENSETIVEVDEAIAQAQGALDAKTAIVTDVRKIVEDSDATFQRVSGAKDIPLINVAGLTYTGRKELAIIIASESLAAEKERLRNADRDDKAAQTELEIQTRRKAALVARNNEINATVLPYKRQSYYEALGKTIGWRALKVVLVMIFAWLLIRLTQWIGEPLIERFVRRSDEQDSFSADEKQRARTLMTVFMTTSRLVIYILAIMFSIAQFDVNYGPLLVAAGGVSLAIGFGAQSLVKDFFSGFFILLEGQFSIGDVVEVGGKIGTVENLNLRTTELRSLNGDVHVIPNGEISATTNMTKEWSRAVVDVGVAYEENTDDVTKVMEAVAEEMNSEPVWGRKLLEYFAMGVQELGDSAVVLRILLKTRAGEQWGVAREYRRRCKLKFDELGIEIPWPQMVMTNKQPSKSPQAKKDQVDQYVTQHKTVEEEGMEGMSIEERDRAEQLAKRQADLSDETDAEPDTRDENDLSDAEVWAKKQTTQMSAEERKARVEERSKNSTGDNDEGEGDGDAGGDGDGGGDGGR